MHDLNRQLQKLPFLPKRLRDQFENVQKDFQRFDSDKKLELGELTKLAKDIHGLINALEGRKTDDPPLTDKQLAEVNKTIRYLKVILLDVEDGIQARQAEEKTPTKPQPMRPAVKLAPVANERLAPEIKLEIKAEVASRALERLIRQEAPRHVLEEIVSKREREVARESKNSSEFFNRLFEAFIEQRLLRLVEGKTREAPELSKKDFQEITEKLNTHLNRLLSASGKKAEIAIYNPERETVEIQVSRNVTQSELVEAVAQLVKNNPQETVKLLLEQAVSAIAQNPAGAEEIISLVAQAIIPETQQTAIIVDQAEQPVKPLVHLKIIKQAIAICLSTTERKNQATAQSEQIVKVAVLEKLAEKAPAVVLPLLIESHNQAIKFNRTEPPAIIKAVVENIVTTPAGQKYILESLANDSIKPILNTTLGKELAGRVLEALVAEAKVVTATPAPVVSDLLKPGANQLANIVRILVDENQAIKNPRLLLRLATEIHELLKSAINPRTASRARRLARAAEAQARYFGRTKQPHSLARSSPGLRAALELVNVARTNNIRLPEAIQKALETRLTIAGGAAVLPMINLRLPNASLPLPQETAAASSTRRILQILEAQQVGKVAARSEAALTRAYIRFAAAFLYGIIKRLVAGKVAEVDVDRVIEELMEREKWQSFVNDVRNGKVQKVTEELYPLILELSEFDKLNFIESVAAAA